MLHEDWDFSFDLSVVDAPDHPGILAGRWDPAMVDRKHLIGRRRVKAAPNRYVYGATKAAVAALTRGRGRFHHQGHTL
jgi:2-keto-3-deoxy-L-fuconate dehydrogenase